jgi:hypothetical protein
LVRHGDAKPTPLSLRRPQLSRAYQSRFERLTS